MAISSFVATLLLCYLIANVFFGVVQCTDPLKVCLPDAGCYIGRYMVSYNEKEIETFLGIPYALPPLRFQTPRRYRSNETHQAKVARCACKQRNYLDHQKPITGSEDCLYLNLYRPSLQYFKLIPVLVHFHGGGFFSGATSPFFLGPEYIMDGQDLVLVTVTYRLGPFGFLGTSDGVIPGNIGLKDQVMALQWVYNNIEYFGGDKFRVTLLGQDAGGMSAHLHTFSRLSRGLFSAIISISGTANSIYAIDENPNQTARLTAKYCNVSNWDTINTRKLYSSLLFMDANTLLSAGDGLKFWNIDSLCNYKPFVEVDKRFSFLTKHPSYYMSNGEFWPVASLFGRVPNEGAVRAVNIMENEDLRNDFNSNFWNLSAKMLEFPSTFSDEKKLSRTKIILDQYHLQNFHLDGNTVGQFMQLLTDRIYYHPMYKTFKYYVDKVDLRKHPLYFYIFKFEGELSYAEKYADHPIRRDYNVIHKDDQIYLFRTRYLFPDIEKNTVAAKMIQIYTRFLSNFVYYREFQKDVHVKVFGDYCQDRYNQIFKLHNTINLTQTMGMNLFGATLLSYLIGNVVFVECIDPLKVCLPDVGCYLGTFMTSINSKELDAFLGIPYAYKTFRFRVSRPYYSNKTHDATKAQCDCKHKNYLVPHRPIVGSEDCLYLNVYRPSLKYFNTIPVIVQFNGVGFFAGTSNPLFTGPDYIMDRQDVILVTVSYRLGPFGFLATSDNKIPGNLGLKDQVIALHWVFNHIEYFGGDKFRITLLGQGSGGISTHMHTFSRPSRGYFSGIISISGTANSIYAIDEDPDYTARQTAKYCNVTNWDKMNTRKLHESLAFMDADILLNAGDHLKYWSIDSFAIYRPIVEIDKRVSFLVKNPKWYIANGENWPVASMFGIVPNEGALRAVNIMENEDLRNDFNSNFLNLTAKILEFPKPFNDEQRLTSAKILLENYNIQSLKLDDETISNFMQLLSDRVFYYPLYNTIKHYVERINLRKYPIYFYIFNFEGESSYAKIYAYRSIKRDYQVVHRDDQLYMFRTQFQFPEVKNNSAEAKMINLYCGFVSHFAYHRQPPFVKNFKRCNRSNFFIASGKICDYHEFGRGQGNSVRMTVKNEW
ncbi:hypothetical protein FF38_14080, partial [Lucilia cuprina]